MSRIVTYIVCYDIRCPLRLRRVHRYLKRRAIALQYSVFITRLDKTDCELLMRDLRVIIHPQQDDIRLYPLPEKPEWTTLGKSLWAGGMHLTGVKLPPRAV